jgi:hypothetical protein
MPHHPHEYLGNVTLLGLIAVVVGRALSVEPLIVAIAVALCIVDIITPTDVALIRSRLRQQRRSHELTE